MPDVTRTVLAVVALCAAAAVQAAPSDAPLWYSLEPVLYRELAAAAQAFNGSQAEFRIVLHAARDGVPRSAEKLSLPLPADRPLLFYNRDAFRAAGLDPAAPPRTWYEMARTLGALSGAGQACAYTTAWPSAVLLGANAGAFDRQLLVRWVSMLSTWQSAGYFSYSGRLDEAEARFTRGECAVLTASSASGEEIRRRAGFEIGMAPLPRYEDFDAGPAAFASGGKPSLWGERNSVGVAKFFAYLATRAARLRRQREAIDRALEAVWSGKRTPVDALSLVKY
jgi:hypothetical protein